MSISATLEIHVINVGQGDSILIINRDLNALRHNLGANATANDIDLLPTAIQLIKNGRPQVLQGTVKKALLIDAGEDMYGSSVVGYLEEQGVVTKGTINAPNFYVLMTHYHSDHIGGLPYIFIELKEVRLVEDVPVRSNRRSKKKQASETRREPVTTIRRVQRYKPERLYFAEKTPEDNCIGAYSLVFEWANKSQGDIHQIPIKAGGLIKDDGSDANEKPLEIDLGKGIDNIPIILRAVAAIAKVWDPINKKLIDVPVKKVDPNDRSVVLMLEYGSFRGFLGGDIAGNGEDAGGNTGEYAMNVGSKQPFSQHGDVESVLMPQLKSIYPKTITPKVNEPKFSTDGYCTFYKVSHHGSSSSNDIYSLGRLTPRIAVISSGLKERFHYHPTDEVMGRLGKAQWKDASNVSTANTTQKTDAQECGIFITEIAHNIKGTDFSTNINDARNIGDVIVRPVDETIKNTQNATTLRNTIQIQVYGSGIQTELSSTQYKLRANNPNSGTSPYPIGPFVFSCDKH